MPISEISSVYTPSIYGRKSFPLTHNQFPIFYKIFDASNSNTVNLTSNIIYIENHFFKTGELLKYNTGTGTSIGINTNSPGALGIITCFPSIVYPIVIDKDNIQISLASSLAISNNPVDITQLGIGTQHSFEAIKQNSKCLISINNIIQSPVSVASTVNVLSYTSSSLELNSLVNVKLGSILRINNEIVKVSSINYDTNQVTISRGNDVLGSNINAFENSLIGSNIEVLLGNYNIIEDVIYFDEPPLESKSLNFSILYSNINFNTSSFTLLDNQIKTGDSVFLLWPNPPKELQSQFYYIIVNGPNNFSFASSYYNALNSIKINFTNNSNNEFQISDFKIIYYYPSESNTFNGRVFLRSNYDGNVIFDDISEQFTGISSSFELQISGVSTVGIKSDNGILLVNNIMQYPGFTDSFSFRESGSSTFVDFVGVGTNGFTGKSYDVNVKGYPRGGIIVSYGTTSGINYMPLTTYDNIPLSGSISGIGASASFNIGIDGNVKDFKFTNFGYGYKTGEILIPSNTTGSGGQIDDDKLHIKINETTKDSFSAWNVGILDKLDDLSSYVNGRRKVFTITQTVNSVSQRVSLDANPGYEIELEYNLLVFVNDVLQIPGSSYTFNGGSKITFSEPIPYGSTLKLYFYKGYYNDVLNSSSLSKLKEGDALQIQQNIYGAPPNQQKSRTIREFLNSDTLRTEIYSDTGLSNSSADLRSVTWTPQKTDLILNGIYISKGRFEQRSGISSFTKIASYVGVFTGISTSFIGIDTTSIQIGDYVEDTFTGIGIVNYVGTGVTIVSIGSSIIGIGTTSYSNSPVGTSSTSLTLYRKQ